MAYDFGGSALVGASYEAEAQADPMGGLSNLADAMLVFACGLMLALVTYWNLDLPSVTELDSAKMKEVSNVEEMVDSALSPSGGYTELGIVYQDPSTGKLYMMRQAEDDGGDGGGRVANEEAPPAAGADAGGE